MPTIKQEMNALDKRDFKWYAGLSEEEQKSLSMWVLMRYASSVDSNVDGISEHYLMMVNDIVNVHFNELRKHPQLQWRLMQVCAIGTSQMHSWVKPGKRKGQVKGNAKMVAFYLDLYPHLGDGEVEWVLNQMSKEDKTGLLESAGIEKKKIKEYLK
jgi:hypothetical protein